jgi:two-component system cell cycle response regulator DivK
MTATPNQSLPEILLLEDDFATTSILRIWLKGICNITAVADGASTIMAIENRLLQNRVFDLMLFDINIPFPWNGLTLMEEICKRFEAYGTVPFVAQTAYAMPQDRDRLLAAGFCDYMAKPLNRELLIRMVQGHLCKTA